MKFITVEAKATEMISFKSNIQYGKSNTLDSKIQEITQKSKRSKIKETYQQCQEHEEPNKICIPAYPQMLSLEK